MLELSSKVYKGFASNVNNRTGEAVVSQNTNNNIRWVKGSTNSSNLSFIHNSTHSQHSDIFPKQKLHEHIVIGLSEEEEKEDILTCHDRKFALLHKHTGHYIPLPCNKWTCSADYQHKLGKLRQRLQAGNITRWNMITEVRIKFPSIAYGNEVFNKLNIYLHRFHRYHMSNKRQICRSNLQFLRIWSIEQFNGELGYWLVIFFNQRIDKEEFYNLLNIAYGETYPYDNLWLEYLHNISVSYIMSLFTSYNNQVYFEKWDRRYSATRHLLPVLVIKTPSGVYIFMSISDAVEWSQILKDNPGLEINGSQIFKRRKHKQHAIEPCTYKGKREFHYNYM